MMCLCSSSVCALSLFRRLCPCLDAETYRKAGARLALAVGRELGFGWFSSQPILVPPAVHVLPRPGKNTISALTTSVAPQWYNFKC